MHHEINFLIFRKRKISWNCTFKRFLINLIRKKRKQEKEREEVKTFEYKTFYQSWSFIKEGKIRGKEFQSLSISENNSVMFAELRFAGLKCLTWQFSAWRLHQSCVVKSLPQKTQENFGRKSLKCVW